MQELVLVIVPIYNSENYLERCIQSIVNQTYKNLEILLINDGSTDSSFDICNKCAREDKRIRIISKSNGGEASARNKGIESAKGKYISFVDNDDYIVQNMIEIMVDSLEKNNCQGAVCSFFYEDEEGTILNWKTPNCRGTKFVSGREACKIFLTSRNIEGFTWNKLFLREEYIKHNIIYGGYPPDIIASYQLLYNCKKVALIDDKLYHYRQVKTSLVHTPKLDKALQSYQTIQNGYDIAQECGFVNEAEYYKSFRNVYSMYDFWKMRKRIGNEWKQYIIAFKWSNSITKSLLKVIRDIICSKNDETIKTICKAIICRVVYR